VTSKSAVDPEIVALVPMRHHSERVPGKNYRVLSGKPLYGYIIETLLACPEITQIVVNTDSPIIEDGISDQYPSVKLIQRPSHLCGDMVPMNEILLYDIDQAPADFYLQTHSTNPLLRAETISRAIQTFLADRERASLFSVTRVQTRLWSGDGKPLNHNPKELLRTQDLPPVYEENSCIYLFNRNTLIESKNRLGERPRLFEIDSSEAWDIDDELDMAIVESLLERRERMDSGEI
jgi:CMP-N-acetylneuraminic acid synthetase